MAAIAPELPKQSVCPPRLARTVTFAFVEGTDGVRRFVSGDLFEITFALCSSTGSSKRGSGTIDDEQLPPICRTAESLFGGHKLAFNEMNELRMLEAKGAASAPFRSISTG